VFELLLKADAQAQGDRIDRGHRPLPLPHDALRLELGHRVAQLLAIALQARRQLQFPGQRGPERRRLAHVAQEPMLDAHRVRVATRAWQWEVGGHGFSSHGRVPQWG
jgi:hypothetical protein